MNEVIHGDCIEEMKKLDDESVDLIISDYPFNIQDDRDDYKDFVMNTVNQYYRLLKETGNLVIINNPHNLFKTSHYFQKFHLRNGVALIKKGTLRPAYHFGMHHN